MALLGFMGEFQGRSSLDALSAYGDAASGQPGLRAQCAHGERHGCWAPEVASEGPIALALTGQPSLAGAPVECTPSRNSAAAILAAYRQSGDTILRALIGPFAIAIVDGSARRALLAIDRMGIERLAYAVRHGGIVFSTSAELVAKCPAVGAALRPQALFDYLMLHMIPAPGTVFQGVQKLRAGTFALFENGTLKLARYWEPQFVTGGRASFETLKTELRQSLKNAVNSETCAAENTGAFLSGGLDSSTVAGLLSGVGEKPAKTFSIGFGYEDYDELAYARIVNAHFGCQGHEYVITAPDIVAAFPLVARAYDEPFGNSSALPAYYCARLARDNGIRHLLAGDGGDELFAGNSRYVEQRVFERYQRAPELLRRGILEPLLSNWPDLLLMPLIRKARGYVDKANIPLPDRLETWNLLTRLGCAEVLSPDFLGAIDPDAPVAQMREVWSSAPSDAYLQRMLYYDWQYTLADNDLRKVETMCALAGVRVSYPMLHPEVVDMSTRVPPALMMPGGKLRDFYKRSMRGFLPDAVLQKKKHGFGLPFGLWLQESPQLRELIVGNLSDLRARGILRLEFIDRLLRLHHQEDARYYGVFVWVLAMLEQWMREHRVAL